MSRARRNRRRMHRAAAVLPRASLPRPGRMLLWVTVALAALAVGGMWLRDSELVRVKHVEVTGIGGPDAARIRALLAEAAREMTTLHVRTDQLHAAVSGYPIVKGLRVERDLPNGLRIIVQEHVPVAAVVVDGARTAVAGDGLLLPGTSVAGLPLVPAAAAAGERIADRRARAAIAALAAAPEELRARVAYAGVSRTEGLVLELRDGPTLRFGDRSRLAAKWAAAAAVLADPTSVGATYIDVRYPERPAAGGLEDPATQGDQGADTGAAQASPAAPTATTPAPQAPSQSQTGAPTP